MLHLPLLANQVYGRVLF